MQHFSRGKMSKTAQTKKEEKPAVIKNLDEVEEEESQELQIQVKDLEEEISLRDLVGRVLVLTHAEITEAPKFHVIHLVFQDGKKTIYARTTSIAVENTVRRLLDQGLNQGVGFRVCVTTRKSSYNTDMLILTNPSVCEKK